MHIDTELLTRLRDTGVKIDKDGNALGKFPSYKDAQQAVALIEFLHEQVNLYENLLLRITKGEKEEVIAEFTAIQEEKEHF